jgi:hypothetical protein
MSGIGHREGLPKRYTCKRASGPIVVDGKLDDVAWQRAPWSDDFVDIEGDKKPPPAKGDEWRVNFSRVEWDVAIVDGKYQKVPDRPEHNWVWTPQGVIDMHQPETWGYVVFA